MGDSKEQLKVNEQIFNVIQNRHKEKRKKTPKKLKINTDYINKSGPSQIEVEQFIEWPDYDFWDRDAMNVVSGEVQRIETLSEYFKSPSNNQRPKSHIHIQINEKDMKQEITSRALYYKSKI